MVFSIWKKAVTPGTAVELLPNDQFLQSAARGSVTGMLMAYQAGADPRARTKAGENVYMLAAANDEVEAIETAHKLCHVPINIVGKGKKTGLYVALENQHARSALKFLELGAYPLQQAAPNRRNVNKVTPDCFPVLLRAMNGEGALSALGKSRKNTEIKCVDETWSPVLIKTWQAVFDPELFEDLDALNEFWEDSIPGWMKALQTHDGNHTAASYFVQCRSVLNQKMLPDMSASCE